MTKFSLSGINTDDDIHKLALILVTKFFYKLVLATNFALIGMSTGQSFLLIDINISHCIFVHLVSKRFHVSQASSIRVINFISWQHGVGNVSSKLL